MDDIDFDEVFGPSQAPSRVSKFQPKSFKPKSKPESLPNLKKDEVESINKKVEEQEMHQSVVEAVKSSDEDLKSCFADDVAYSNFDPDLAKVEGVDGMDEDDSATDMDADEVAEDHVVREIDVFFTPSDVNNRVYVLQYPLKPSWRPFELEEQCKEVRLKPVSAEVELDLSVDTDSPNYDSEAGVSHRETQTLSSMWKTSQKKCYAVGVLMGDKLHLNPIHAIVQLRPSSKQTSSDEPANKNASEGAESQVKHEGTNKENLIEPKGQQKRQSKMKVDMDEHKTHTEDWVALKYYGPDNDLSKKYLAKMVASEVDPIPFSMSSHDYVYSLCPGTLSHMKPKRLSKSLLLLPIEERIKTWLCEGPPVNRFNSLKHICPNESVEEVLGILKKQARLVQGYWVLKSSLKFEGGGGREVMARDYVLLLFSRNPVVKSSQLIGNLSQHMRLVLNQFGAERTLFNDWKFREAADVSFMKMYPGLVKEQELLWEGVHKQLAGFIQVSSKGGPNAKGNIRPLKSETSLISDKTAKQVTSGTVPRKMIMSNETQEAVHKALKKVFQVHKACSFQLICQGLRDFAVSLSSLPKADARAAVVAAHAVDGPKEELQSVISQVAINIHGVYVLKSSLDNPEYDPFRTVVINLFCAKGSNAKFRKSDFIEAGKIALKREITNNEYTKVLNEICVSRGPSWTLKNGEANPK